MLDFDHLTCSYAEDRKNSYSFVGIKGDEFLLPLGFSKKKKSYTEKKNIFFLLYRALRNYTKKLKVSNKQIVDDRDGTGNKKKAKSNRIDIGDGGESLEYVCLSGLDDVLSGFDELRLFALRERLQRSDDIDYSQIHSYLDHAIFLPDNSMYIDQMLIPKATLAYHTTDLVRMYCYIYSQIKKELKEGISSEVNSEAKNFADNYLSPSDALFEEGSCKRTSDVLCDQLERIEQYTAFKDDDFWHFFEAIESFLYDNKKQIHDKDKKHWGINNFCFVWEDMCQEKVEHEMAKRVLYTDRLGIVESPNLQEWCGTFTFTSPKGKTEIRPDLIVQGEFLQFDNENSTEEKGCSIIDFKYKVDPDDADMQKQLVYEYAASNIDKPIIQNICVMPASKEIKEINEKNGITCVYWPIDGVLSEYVCG